MSGADLSVLKSRASDPGAPGETVELYQQAKMLWVQAVYNNNNNNNLGKNFAIEEKIQKYCRTNRQTDQIRIDLDKSVRSDYCYC